MTAINVMGAPAQNPLQALARLLPSGKSSRIPLSIARKHQRRGSMQLVTSDTGMTAYMDGAPVAWIVPGYHQGKANHEPKRCDFVDVAYHRKTDNGVNMETADFLTLEEAVAFVSAVFSGKAGAA